jgi:hypothetical protein
VSHVPPASFLNFLGGIGAQGLIHLGALPHPVTGERAVDPELARYTVDLLGILEEKSRGNRTPEEDTYLVGMVDDLRGKLAKLSAAS